VWLGNGREGELGDCARPKHDTVGGAAVLEVAEFVTLRDVVAGLDVQWMMQEETSDMPTGTKATRPITDHRRR
jgi:hypothetical protein